MNARLYKQYNELIVPKLMKELGMENRMQVPKITKIVLNIGYNREKAEHGMIELSQKVLERISGQKPVITISTKSISNFKIREGQENGTKVTLRKQRMWEFLDKLINVTLPRVRDFRGISPKVVDKNGNMSVGFKEHLSFPEIHADEVDKMCSLQVCIATTAKSKEHGVQLFKAFGFPFSEN